MKKLFTLMIKLPRSRPRKLTTKSSRTDQYTLLVDMDKKALDREEKANNERNGGIADVTNDDRAYATIELGDDFGDKVGETEGKVPNSSSIKLAPRSSSTKRRITQEHRWINTNKWSSQTRA